MAHCNVVICLKVTLLGDAKQPKVADAVIKAYQDLELLRDEQPPEGVPDIFPF